MGLGAVHAPDLAACLARLRTGSKSFSAAARLLPPRVRESATVLYAFCRVADDAVDTPVAPTDAHATSREARAAAIAGLRARLDAVYAGRPDRDPVDRALASVVARERVPRVLLDALLEGMAWDAEERRYETLEALLAYAARVAGAVGAMMAVVMGRRDPNVVARACDLGVAMQLTNIARDVGEDARAGRLYLPLHWLRQVGIDPAEWMARPVHGPALAGVVERLLAAAGTLYARADAGVPELPSDCRTAIRSARLIYSDIGRAVAAAGFDAVTRRAVISWWRKLRWLAVAAFGSRTAIVDGGRLEAPPLEATRFLVDACAERA
jgi:phytoene synthase